MAKKRVTRKQLLKEPDEFITLTGKIIRFVKKYQTQILSVTCGLVIIILLMAGINYYLKLSESKAFALFDRASTQYALLLKSNGPQKAYHDVQKDFEALIDKYPGRNGGKIAKVAYANICYSAGDYAKAVELYDKALKDFSDNSFIMDIILSSLGHAYEKAGDHKAATRYFERIVAGSESKMKDEALFNLGGIYFYTGDKTKSDEAFKKIMTENVDSIYIDIVNEKNSG